MFGIRSISDAAVGRTIFPSAFPQNAFAVACSVRRLFFFGIIMAKRSKGRVKQELEECGLLVAKNNDTLTSPVPAVQNMNAIRFHKLISMRTRDI